MLGALRAMKQGGIADLGACLSRRKLRAINFVNVIVQDIMQKTDCCFDKLELPNGSAHSRIKRMHVRRTTMPVKTCRQIASCVRLRAQTQFKTYVRCRHDLEDTRSWMHAIQTSAVGYGASLSSKQGIAGN